MKNEIRSKNIKVVKTNSMFHKTGTLFKEIWPDCIFLWKSQHSIISINIREKITKNCDCLPGLLAAEGCAYPG